MPGLICTISRPLNGRLVVTNLPYNDGSNRRWLRRVIGCNPIWDGERRAWLVARHHLDSLSGAIAERYCLVRVRTSHHSAERCDTRCQAALGDECECSCLGLRHGGRGGEPRSGWALVGSTTLVGCDTVVAEWIVRRAPSAA